MKSSATPPPVGATVVKPSSNLSSVASSGWVKPSTVVYSSSDGDCCESTFTAMR